jgi:hypothetical protein
LSFIDSNFSGCVVHRRQHFIHEVALEVAAPGNVRLAVGRGRGEAEAGQDLGVPAAVERRPEAAESGPEVGAGDGVSPFPVGKKIILQNLSSNIHLTIKNYFF